VSTAVFAAVTPTNVLAGGTAQAGANWSIAVPTPVANTSTINIVANPNGETIANANCTGADDVAFATPPPTVTVTGNGTSQTGVTDPTITATLHPVNAQNACSSVDNELTLEFTSAGVAPTGTTGWIVTVSGITYNVGAGAAANPGPIGFAQSSYENSTSTTGATVDATLVPSDATVVSASVTANSPKTGLIVGADTNAAISPVVITESAAGGVPAGYVCVLLNTSDPAAFDVAGSSAPTITDSVSQADLNPAGVIASTNGQILEFDVVTPTTTSPATFTLKNLHVNGNSSLGPDQAVVVDDASSSCTGGTTIGTVQLFNEISSSRTAGQDADATAIDAFEAEYPGTLAQGAGAGVGVPKTIVLATDSNYPDALSASYLEGQLGTGIFLTPTAALSTETETAIEDFGINTVDVVGGPDSVSPAVIATLKALPVEQFGGQTPVSPAQTMTVNQIFGQTQYDTSQAADAYLLTKPVGTGAFPLAYGNYDDVSGALSSTAGSATPVNTAIVASGEGFQDAVSASVVSYKEHFPVVLTEPTALSTQAAATLTNLNIKQVIVVGGPESVSNADVTSIEALGISVLRIAGEDATDTSQQLAQFELNSASTTAGASGLGWDAGKSNQVVLTNGAFYADALSAAGFASTGAGPATNTGNPEPILLTEDPNTIGQYLESFLETGGSPNGFAFPGDTSGGRINTINVVGGIDSVTGATLDNALDFVITG